jgi:hypothetical protein
VTDSSPPPPSAAVGANGMLDEFGGTLNSGGEAGGWVLLPCANSSPPPCSSHDTRWYDRRSMCGTSAPR